MKKITVKQLVATAAILGLATMNATKDYFLCAINGMDERQAKTFENFSNSILACAGTTITVYATQCGKWVYIINVNA